MAARDGVIVGYGIEIRLARVFIARGKQHADRVCVTAHANNQTADRFYQKLGFTPESLEFELRL